MPGGPVPRGGDGEVIVTIEKGVTWFSSLGQVLDEFERRGANAASVRRTSMQHNFVTVTTEIANLRVHVFSGPVDNDLVRKAVAFAIRYEWASTDVDRLGTVEAYSVECGAATT